MSDRPPRPHWSRLVHRRLLLRLTLPGLIGVVLLILAVVDLVRGHVPPLVLLWLVIGIATGYPFGHMTKVAWDSDKSQLVQDGSGLLLLAGYLVLRLGERFLLNPAVVNLPYVTNGAALAGAGLLIGRFLGMRRTIRRALAEAAF